MATFDKLIQEIGSRYCLGPTADPLVQETLGLISGQPGGIGSFVNRFKAAGFEVEAASWLGESDPVPLSGQEVEQTLGCEVVSSIANKIGVSQSFARTILGYAIPEIIVLRARGGDVPQQFMLRRRVTPTRPSRFRPRPLRKLRCMEQSKDDRAERNAMAPLT